MDLPNYPEFADLMNELAEADPADVELDLVYSTSEQGGLEQTDQQTKVVLKMRKALEVR
jgi:hypothetical protein